MEKSYKIRELDVKYKTRKTGKEMTVISCPEAVWKFSMTVLENATQEHFMVISLNHKNEVHGFFTAAIGTVSEALVHPREVFKSALLVNASGVILIHNHPSGNVTPSKEDGQTTTRLVEAGKILGIVVVDHIIVTDEEFYSFKEEGLI